jgi:hypothetical protein
MRPANRPASFTTAMLDSPHSIMRQATNSWSPPGPRPRVGIHDVSHAEVSTGREQPLHWHDSGKSPIVQHRDVVHRLERLPAGRGTHLPD